MRLIFWTVCSWSILLICGCTNQRESREVLTVFVAASLTDVVQQVGEEFEAQHDVSIVYNFASSGALAQQLIASPKADIYFGASELWAEMLIDEGVLEPLSKRTLFGNRLALIANERAHFDVKDPSEIPSLRFDFFAMGHPDFVPAGEYAKQWLSSIKAEDSRNVWTAIQNRISYANDVRGALMQVAGQSDVIGLVYESDARAREGVKILWLVEENRGPIIRFPVGLIKASEKRELASMFIDHLSSDESKKIFVDSGFIALED
jgi:molybdate transport system substrate-binding protein